MILAQAIVGHDAGHPAKRRIPLILIGVGRAAYTIMLSILYRAVAIIVGMVTQAILR